jgi:hypothetical protein
MKIITKKAYHFIDGEIVVDENGEKTRKIKNSIVVKPSVYPQQVPDWSSNDELFDIAIKDGGLTVVK